MTTTTKITITTKKIISIVIVIIIIIINNNNDDDNNNNNNKTLSIVLWSDQFERIKILGVGAQGVGIVVAIVVFCYSCCFILLNLSES